MATSQPLSGSCPTVTGTVPAVQHVCVDVRGLVDRPVDALRVMLIGDVLRRLLTHTAPDSVAAETIDDPSGPLFDPETAAHEFGLQSTHHCQPRDTARLLADASTVVVAPAERAHDTRVTARQVSVESVKTQCPQRLAGQTSGDFEPLAVKLALLRFPHNSPATLSAARLRRSAATLDRWRIKIMGWKDQPTAPPQDLRSWWALFEDDLGTAQVLRSMHRIELQHVVSSGTKYSTFSKLDEVLALDLHRKCGNGYWWHS